MSENRLNTIIKPHDCVLAFGVPCNEDDFTRDLNIKNKDFATSVNNLSHFKRNFLLQYNQIIPELKAFGVNIANQLKCKDFGELFLNDKYKVIILFTHWKECKESQAVVNIDNYIEFLKKDGSFLKTVPHSNGCLSIISKNGLLNNAPLYADFNICQSHFVTCKENKVYINDFNKLVKLHLKDIKEESFLFLLEHTNESEIEFEDGLTSVYHSLMQIPKDSEKILDLNVCHPEMFTVAMRKCRPDIHIKYPYGENIVYPKIMLYVYYALFKYLKHNEIPYFDAVDTVFKNFKKPKL